MEGNPQPPSPPEPPNRPTAPDLQAAPKLPTPPRLPEPPAPPNAAMPPPPGPAGRSVPPAPMGPIGEPSPPLNPSSSDSDNPFARPSNEPTATTDGSAAQQGGEQWGSEAAGAGPPPIPDPPTKDSENLASAEAVHETESFEGSSGSRVEYQGYNAENDVSTRPCENCGGLLAFNIEHQQLGCESCGHLQDIVHDEGAQVLEQDFQAMMVAARSKKNERLHHEDNEKEIVCQNCGGHTTFVGSLTTTKCPYCATDLSRTDIHDAPDRLAVDGVLPFAITEKEAGDKLKQWVNKRWFAPNEFKKYSNAGSFQSIYAAYFTYDADVSTDYDGSRGTTRTRTVGSGNNRRTETYTTWRRVNGRVYNQFDDITVLANTGFNAGYVGKLEPWPTQQVEPYNPDYIVGHLCRTYDIDAKDSFQEAHTRIKSEVEHTVRRDIGGDKQRINRMNMRMSNLTYKHVLLPIWLLTVIYDGQAMQVFMNGTTGEIHGERPWSTIKIAATVMLVVVIIAIILAIKSASGQS